jgi:hypothetical protein
MPSRTPDRLNQLVWLMLAILGVILTIVAWRRFIG